jgi:hypothetical protein
LNWRTTAAVVARAEAQRVELAQTPASWRGPLTVVDQGWAAVRYLDFVPVLVKGVVASLSVCPRVW